MLLEIGAVDTSMGCHGPKSVTAIRNDLMLLDLTDPWSLKYLLHYGFIKTELST